MTKQTASNSHARSKKRPQAETGEQPHHLGCIAVLLAGMTAGRHSLPKPLWQLVRERRPFGHTNRRRLNAISLELRRVFHHVAAHLEVPTTGNVFELPGPANEREPALTASQMHSRTVPGGVHPITTARRNDAAPLSALGTVGEIDFHHTWTQHLRHIQPPLLGLNQQGATEGPHEEDRKSVV